MKTFGQRLRTAIKNRDITQANLVEKLDISGQTLQQWLRDDNYPSIPNLLNLSEELDTSPAWLLFGTGDEQRTDIVEIPEYDVKFSGGNGNLIFEEMEPSRSAYYRREWFVKHGINPADCIRGRVKGDSMVGTLWDDDIVLIHRGETEIYDGRVYAIRIGHNLRVKRLQLKTDGTVKLISDNDSFDDEIVPMDDDFQVIGRVRDKSGRGGL
ncbi:MAG: helix-turn-helix domain-containing protein [Burkholderiales bacterium]|nr:helix-turn-helix domain-containing protein [Burkholderiales bacterium]